MASHDSCLPPSLVVAPALLEDPFHLGCSFAMFRSASFSSSQPPAKQPFSFGGSSTTATNTTAPSATNTTTQPTFSFGGASNNDTSAASNQPASSNTSAGPSTTFSFGAPAANAQSQQQQPGQTGAQPSSSFSFGGFGQQPQQQQQQQQQPQQAQTGNTFGQSTFGGGSSLFGSSLKPAQPTTSGGLLGSSTFGDSLNSSTLGSQFNQQPQQQSQPFSNTQSPFANHAFYQKERFNDLSDDARKLVEEMDKMIRSQTSLRDELSSKLIPSANSTTNLAPLGQKISQLYSTLHSASLALTSLSSALEREVSNVQSLASTIESDRQDFAVLWEIGDAFRQGSTSSEARRDWIREYFTKAAEDFYSKIVRYRASMEQIERHLASLSSRDSNSPQAISDTIYFQHSTFMNLASQVAHLHADVEVLKRDYRNWYARNGSVRDPFEMGELGGMMV